MTSISYIGKPGMVLHAFNPSTREAESGRFLSSRTAWSTEWVPEQPGLRRETLSRKTKQNKTNRELLKHSIYWMHVRVMAHVSRVASSPFSPSLSWVSEASCQAKPRAFTWQATSPVPAYFCCLFVFQDRVSLCSPDCPGTHSLDQYVFL